MVEIKLNIAEVFQSERKEIQREMLQKIMDTYLQGSLTYGSDSVHP